MNPHSQGSVKRTTARHRIAAVLTQEILSHPTSKDFPIASEHDLCRRFGVSRVTIRLSLADLEYRGLIYRRHGKGTFAHGFSGRVHRNIGILIKAPDALRCARLVDIIRGVQAVVASLRSCVVLISTSPLEWPAEMTGNLGAIVVIRDGVTSEELDSLKKRNLPFLCLEVSEQMVEDNQCFYLGLRIAETLNDSALTGEPVDESKFR